MRIIENVLESADFEFDYTLGLTGSWGLALCGLLPHRPAGDMDVVVKVDNEDDLQEVVDYLLDWKYKFTTNEIKCVPYCNLRETYKFVGMPIEGVKIDIFVLCEDVGFLPKPIAGMTVTTPGHTFKAKCGNLEARPDLAKKAKRDIEVLINPMLAYLKDMNSILEHHRKKEEIAKSFADTLPTELPLPANLDLDLSKELEQETDEMEYISPVESDDHVPRAPYVRKESKYAETESERKAREAKKRRRTLLRKGFDLDKVVKLNKDYEKKLKKNRKKSKKKNKKA